MSTQSIIGHTLLASCMLAISASAVAVPFWTGYRGTIENSTIPTIKNDEKYTVNLIFDNGGTTSENQTWTREHLKCMVWYMNDDMSVVFAQDLTKPGTNFNTQGQITTDSSGTKLTMFTQFGTTGTDGPGSGTYASRGFNNLLTDAYARAPHTYFEDLVFIAGAPGSYEYNFGDTRGSIPMRPSAWQEPTPFLGWGIQTIRGFADLGGCADYVPPPPPSAVTSVPALGLPALALLALGAAALGGLRLRRNKP